MNKESDIENGHSPDDESKKKNDLICVHNRGELVLFSCAIVLLYWIAVWMHFACAVDCVLRDEYAIGRGLSG